MSCGRNTILHAIAFDVPRRRVTVVSASRMNVAIVVRRRNEITIAHGALQRCRIVKGIPYSESVDFSYVHVNTMFLVLVRLL